MPRVTGPLRLPETAPTQAWMELALCRGLVDLFFEAEEQAKEVCRLCPVRTPCLEYALAIEDWNGCWGGMTGKERMVEFDRRKRKGS